MNNDSAKNPKINPLLVSKLADPNDPSSKKIDPNLTESAFQKMNNLNLDNPKQTQDHGLNQDFLLHLSQLPEFQDQSKKIQDENFYPVNDNQGNIKIELDAKYNSFDSKSTNFNMSDYTNKDLNNPHKNAFGFSGFSNDQSHNYKQSQKFSSECKICQ